MNKLIIVLGASGSGKSFLANKIVESNPSKYKKIVTATTRKIRLKDNEVDGVSYYFLSNEEFESMDFLEKSRVGSNQYGILSSELNVDQDLVAAIEPYGADSLLKLKEKGIIERDIFIIYLDINEEERAENMRSRGDTDTMISDRILIDNIPARMEETGINPDLIISERRDDLLSFVLSKL